MQRTLSSIERITVIGFAWLVVVTCGCSNESEQQQPLRPQILGESSHLFDIHWPPMALGSKSVRATMPLLRGDISIGESHAENQSSSLELVVKIIRPSDERGRRFWNSQLAYSSVPWMDEVRVWDPNSQWQWPNLPFLLRRHGQERIERYGGVDPGKLVDNDFAAVLIRSFDVTGKTETILSQVSPLVSAEWSGDIDGDTDIHSVIHVARSEKFRVHLGKTEGQRAGLLKIWLIYADFLGSRPPIEWPQDPEWAGGILNYCEIRWEKPAGEACLGTVEFLTPTSGTEFDWEKWSNDPLAPAQSRLSDTPK